MNFSNSYCLEFPGKSIPKNSPRTQKFLLFPIISCIKELFYLSLTIVEIQTQPVQFD